MEIENKNIIITGASGGIGAAAAHFFADEGAMVVLGARDSMSARCWLTKSTEAMVDGPLC